MGWSWAAACGVEGRRHIVRPRLQLVFCVDGRQMKDGGPYGCVVPIAYVNRNRGLTSDECLAEKKCYYPRDVMRN